ncbi:DUF4401 domain-containing protein [Psychrobacter glacincola]|uniref:DUF4401 domain-containing protein n=1 Tax=Psychrobacter glacincola TaxID=56810 RepID=UPI003FD5FF6C
MTRPSTSPIPNTYSTSQTSRDVVDGRTWYRFFTRFTAITSATALVLALIFFIAYNWIYMGKIGKFGLVEGALTLSILGYALLAYRGIYPFAQQLLLLIASVITGGLLALVGQVYQTGADSWQLFFAWAVFIIPWVLIARLPALWLLWLGLVNLSFMLYSDAGGFWFANGTYSHLLYLTIITAINSLALTLALKFADKLADKEVRHGPTSSIETEDPKVKTITETITLPLHWSVYVVGTMVVYFATRLGLYPVLNLSSLLSTVLAFGAWLAVMGYFYGRFRKKQIDLLMLTLLSGSVIIVLMVIANQYIAPYLGDLELFALAFMLIALSASAVNWLRKLNTDIKQLSVSRDGSKNQTEMNVDSSNSFEDLEDLESFDDLEDFNSSQTVDNAEAIKAPITVTTPWYLQLFLGLSGLLSGALITGFLVVLLNTALRDTPIKLILSVLLLFISLVLFNPHFFRRSLTVAAENNRDKSHTFSSSLAFALSLSAQAFLGAVLFESFDASARVSIFMLVQVLLFAIIQDSLHRFFSAFIALGCLVWLLSYYQLPELSAAVLALIATVTSLPIAKLPFSKPPKRLPFTQQLWLSTLIKPLNYASTVMLLMVSVLFIAAEHTQYIVGVATEFTYNYPLAQTLLVAVCLYAAHLILSHYQLKLTSKTGRLIGLSIICLGIVSVYVSGILATSLVIIMAVANQNKTLLGLGISALVGYVFWYYYQLDSSLLMKSGSLMAVALVLFAIRKLLNREHFVHSSLLRLYPTSSPADKSNDDVTKEEELP